MATATATATSASAAKSTAAAAMTDEDNGARCVAGCTAEDVLEIDRHGGRRRGSLNGGQEKQTARQSGHGRHGCFHDNSP
jgi:hypothetical protein